MKVKHLKKDFKRKEEGNYLISNINAEINKRQADNTVKNKTFAMTPFSGCSFSQYVKSMKNCSHN